MDNFVERENSQKQQKQIAIFKMDEDGISAPNWLFEVLAWISRIEMANSQLSFSCKLFKQLCFPKLHENVKPHKITHLEFRADWRPNSGYLRVNNQTKQLPTPTVPPPPYILGFNHIFMQFLDAKLLEFVQNILPRLNKIKFSVAMRFYFYQWTLEDKRTKDFRRLLDLLADKIGIFIFQDYPGRVSKFNKLFPGFLQKVDFLSACPIPEEFDILFNWLALPSINGEKKQKILKLKTTNYNANDTDKFIGRIKEQFFNANAPLNIFIECPFSSSRVAHFNMENEKTGEILTTYQTKLIPIYNLILRCPKGEENYWIDEGQRKLEEYWKLDNENETFILAQIEKFGD